MRKLVPRSDWLPEWPSKSSSNITSQAYAIRLNRNRFNAHSSAVGESAERTLSLVCSSPHSRLTWRRSAPGFLPNSLINCGWTATDTFTFVTQSQTVAFDPRGRGVSQGHRTYQVHLPSNLAGWRSYLPPPSTPEPTVQVPPAWQEQRENLRPANVAPKNRR